MKKFFLRPAGDRILVEQLLLLYSNLGSSVVPGVVLAALLVITLSNDANRNELLLWCACVMASKLYASVHARRQLAAGITVDNATLQVTRLMLMKVIYGASWGALAWITLDNANASGNILVLAVLAGVLGNNVALLSPVLPIFMSFILAMALVLAVHPLWMNDVNYAMLLTASIMYLISLLGQARNGAKAARTAIELAFENDALIIMANKAQLEAEQSNQIKSKFLAAASHDLRQPIHAQGLFLEVLSRTDLTDYQSNVLARSLGGRRKCIEKSTFSGVFDPFPTS